MTWQDLVLSAGTICFSIGLLPSIFSEHKPAWLTSLINGIALVGFVIAYISLELTFSAVTTSVTAALWFVLMAQSLRRSPVR